MAPTLTSTDECTKEAQKRLNQMWCSQSVKCSKMKMLYLVELKVEEDEMNKIEWRMEGAVWPSSGHSTCIA